MKQRVLSAALLAPIAVVLVLLGGAPYFIGITVMCLAALWECSALTGMSEATGTLTIWRYATLVAGACLLFGVYEGQNYSNAPEAAAAVVLLGSLGLLVLGGEPAKRVATWAAGAAAIAYVIGTGLHFILLRETKMGLTWTLLVCACTWSTDIGAFFVGRRYGKHTFFHSISPKKTLEGAIGGFISGIAAVLLVVEIGGLPVPLIQAVGLGAIASIAAEAGDLVESLAKRESGVKDSGTLIPGHGGVLDRIDSLLFVVTVVYVIRVHFA